MRCEGLGKIHSFRYGYPTAPAPMCSKDHPLFIELPLQFSVFSFICGSYFGPYSLSLISVSVLSPVSPHVNSCCFIMSLGLNCGDSPLLFLLLRIVQTNPFTFLPLQIWVLACRYLQNNPIQLLFGNVLNLQNIQGE